MTVCPVIAEVTSTYSKGSYSSERKYIVRGPTTRTAANGEVAAYTAGYDGTMIRKGWSLKQTSLTTWEATVRYSSEYNLGIGDVTKKISTKGGTQTITHGLSHISTTTAADYPGTHPGHFGAINVTKDGVQGCEIELPTLRFTVSKGFAPGTITEAYQLTLAALTTTVNDALWYGWAKGQIFFHGAETTLNLDLETVEYDFSISYNQNSVTIGNITKNGTGGNPAKEGWHYMWVESIEKKEGTHVVQKPTALHIEKIYQYGNFALLGI